jgi:2-C-methyl-D-erythritol 4-phosphate cytidylyltransferase
VPAVALLVSGCESPDGPDALAPCGGKPLIAWSLEALQQLDAVQRVVVALPGCTDPPAGTFAVPVRDDLAATVEDALAAAGPAAIAIVHDPLRPVVDGALFARALAGLREHGCDAVVAAEPLTDTLKRVDGDGRIVETLRRGEAWQIQTPQVYRIAALRRALAAARRRLDEGGELAPGHALLPACVEGPVRVVGVPRDSLHVRRAADLAVVELVLSGSG